MIVSIMKFLCFYSFLFMFPYIFAFIFTVLNTVVGFFEFLRIVINYFILTHYLFGLIRYIYFIENVFLLYLCSSDGK